MMIRPVREGDIDGLLELLKSIPDSITSLQPKGDYLESRIHESLRSFYPVVNQPGSEKYMFVLEDAVEKRLAGTCSIYAKTGGFEPSYTYEIIENVFRYEPLNIETHIEELHLRIDHEGPSELGGLFLLPEYRGGGNGGMLSRSRFLFAKAFPERFTADVMAEFRGVVTKKGIVPFWEAIGRHFFVEDFSRVDQYSAVSRKDFIRDLMPQHPIYIPLLPKSAQKVIGKPHSDAEPAVHVLKKEGFKYINQVDIFDAGPIYQACFRDTLSFENSSVLTVESIANKLPSEKAVTGLIASTTLNFRAVSGELSLSGNSVTLDRKTAEYLEVEIGSEVIFLP